MFDTLEQEVITSKEDQIMISTASKIFNEGVKEGIEKSIKKGMEEGIKEIALRMLQQDMELQLISQLTGLSIKQLQKLKK